MRKPFHEDVRHPVGLARPRRPLAYLAFLSQGHSHVAQAISGSFAGAELGHSCGCDLPLYERSCDTLIALISTFFMGWMPCASVPA